MHGNEGRGAKQLGFFFFFFFFFLKIKIRRARKNKKKKENWKKGYCSIISLWDEEKEEEKLPQMLGNLKDEALVVFLNLKGVQNGGESLIELNIDDGSDDRADETIGDRGRLEAGLII